MDKIFYLHFCRKQVEVNSLNTNERLDDCVNTIANLPADILCNIFKILAFKSRFDDIVFSRRNGRFFQGRHFRTYWCPVILVSRQFKDAYDNSHFADIICNRCNLFCNTNHSVSNYWKKLRVQSYCVNSKVFWIAGFYDFRRTVGYAIARHDMCKIDKLSFMTNGGLDRCFRVVVNSGSAHLVNEFCQTMCILCDWKPKFDLLFKAAMFGRIDMMQILLDTKFCTIQTGGTYALRKALRWNRYDAVKFLLLNGAVPTKKLKKRLLRRTGDFWSPIECIEPSEFYELCTTLL